MNFSILSDTINVKYEGNKIESSDSYIYTRPHFKIKEDDFFLDIKNVARYRVQEGQTILVDPYENADKESVKLFLDGSALGALLHQRGILPFHSSSFLYKDKGIMVCGDSGAGKSSLTAAFFQQGASFINDDITPVSISDPEITIIPVKTQMKLWDDSLNKLNIDSNNLLRIRPKLNKFYLPMDKNISEHRLDQIFILSIHNKDEFMAIELKGIDKYNVLRNQIYRKVYLRGMPEIQKKYFKQLFLLAKNIPVIRVTRPNICEIDDTMRFIEKKIIL
ncbi:MAG: hypothetical protein WCR82_06540 [Bacteroidales bacterium]|jgi:hypothetical protein